MGGGLPLRALTVAVAVLAAARVPRGVRADTESTSDEDEPGRVYAAQGSKIKFYMYSDPALDMSHLFNCPGFKGLIYSPHGEGLQEVHVYNRLKEHPQRVRDPAQANAFFLPIMEYTSWKVHTCNGQTHEERFQLAHDVLKRSKYFKRFGGNDHFWVSSKSHAFGPDLVGTQYANLTAAVSIRFRMQPLSKILRKTVVGRMKPFGRRHPKSPSSSVGKCTFDVGHQPNQESLSVWKPGLKRDIFLYFAGSFDVCCTGKFIRCRMGEILAGTDGDKDVRLVPSRGGRGSGRMCTETAMNKVAVKRGITVDALDVEYKKLAAGETGDRYVTMARTMAQSVFCLAPAGDICTSSRFYSAIAAGCIPVVLCDGIKGAFAHYVDYEQLWFKYDTTLFMDNPMGLVQALRNVNATQLARMQRAVEDARNRVLFQTGNGSGAVHNLLSEVYECMHPPPKRPQSMLGTSKHKRDGDGADGDDDADEHEAGDEAAAASTGTAMVNAKVLETMSAIQRQQLTLLRSVGVLTDRIAALERRASLLPAAPRAQIDVQ